MKKSRKIFLFATLLATCYLPLATSVLAVDAPGAGSQRLITIINRLTNWLLGLLIVISSVFIIYAAYLYLTAGASPDNAKKAGQIILYASIAIGVGLLSKVFVFIVQELVR